MVPPDSTSNTAAARLKRRSLIGGKWYRAHSEPSVVVTLAGGGRCGGGLRISGWERTVRCRTGRTRAKLGTSRGRGKDDTGPYRGALERAPWSHAPVSHTREMPDKSFYIIDGHAHIYR